MNRRSANQSLPDDNRQFRRTWVEPAPPPRRPAGALTPRVWASDDPAVLVPAPRERQMSDTHVEPAPRHRKAPVHTVEARSLKVSVVLDPSAVAKIPVGPSDDRTKGTRGNPLFRQNVGIAPGETAQHVADEHGVTARTVERAAEYARDVDAAAEGVVAMLQGKLVEGDVLAEAGLTVQPKAVPKPPQALTATE